MLRLSNIKVLPKLVAVIALIGLIVGGCVWYAQSQMATIDHGYSQFISNDAAAVSESRRLNRLIIELNYWVYRIIAETDPIQMQAANLGFEATVPNVKALLPELRAHAPGFSTRTDEVTSNITGVTQASEETGAAATQVLAAADDLSRRSEHLGAEVSRFLSTVRAA